MRVVRNYKSYEEYVNHQKEKTLDPVRRRKWLGKEWEQKIKVFLDSFKKILPSPNIEGKKWLCVGARTGQEVVAFDMLGASSPIGVDLVSCPPYVKEDDMHNMSFPSNTFDGVFSNILDHSVDPKKFISEIQRVVKPHGLVLLHLQVGKNLAKPGLQGYDICELSSWEEVVKFFDTAEVLESRKCNY